MIKQAANNAEKNLDEMVSDISDQDLEADQLTFDHLDDIVEEIEYE